MAAAAPSEAHLPAKWAGPDDPTWGDHLFLSCYPQKDQWCDAEHIEKTAQLEKKIDFSMPPSHQHAMKHHKRLFLVKFLIARKWDVDAAYDMLKGTATFRLEKKIEETPLFPSAIPVRGYDVKLLQDMSGRGPRPTNQGVDAVHSQLRSVYAACWHKWDKHGRPVYIERTGKVRTKELVKLSTTLVPPGADNTAPIREFHLHSNTVGEILADYRNRNLAPGHRPVSQITVIMDCDGMNMDSYHGPALEIMQANSKMDQAYYPEMLYRLYLVNAPTTIKIGWAIAKRWLDERVQKKIFFCSPGKETVKALSEHFNPEDLPSFLGGSCSCVGGCVPELEERAADAGTALTEEFKVKNGEKAVREVTVASGETVGWEFVTVERHIKFQVDCIREDGPPVVVVKDEKMEKHVGSFKCRSPGKVVFVFDNTYSSWHDKVVRFRSSVIDTSHFGSPGVVGSPGSPCSGSYGATELAHWGAPTAEDDAMAGGGRPV